MRYLKNNFVLLRDRLCFVKLLLELPERFYNKNYLRYIHSIVTAIRGVVWGKNPKIPSPEPNNQSSKVVLDGPNLTLCEFPYPAAHLASLIRRLLIKINCYQIPVS